MVIKIINHYAHRLRYDGQVESCRVEYKKDGDSIKVALDNDWRVRHWEDMNLPGGAYSLLAGQLSGDAYSFPPIDFTMPKASVPKSEPRPLVTSPVL